MRTVAVVNLGLIAHDILAASEGSEADVFAVFDRSTYIMTNHGFVCVGGQGIGEGPINVLIGDTDLPLDWALSGVYLEAKARIAGGQLVFGDDLAIAFAGAPVWVPDPWHVRAKGFEVAVSHVRDLLATKAEKEGLAAIALDPRRGPQTDVAKAAQLPLQNFKRGLAEALSSGVASDFLKRAATLLVGLGPGLTPSGDDVLGGVFMALSALGRDDVRDQMWETIGPELDMLTVPMSAMHLAAAADGLGAGAMHELINGIVTGDLAAIDRAFPRVLAIGATSGADAVAGVILAMDAIVAQGLQ